jgi:UV DNA damage endonuclease
MSLGICCQWLESRTKRDGTTIYENIIDEKSLQLGQFKAGKYDDKRIVNTYINNVEEHIKIVPKLVENNIRSFRISSSLFPLFEFNRQLAVSSTTLLSRLETLGKLFRESGIRVTTHPGQFTVLSSDRDEVVQNSIRELEYHAWVFDMMGFEQTTHYAINIHGGKADRSERLIDVIKTLPANVKNRLTLENDEKCYNVKQLIQIHEVTGVPIVLDSHHYNFNSNDLVYSDAHRATKQSWGEIKPLQHISNTEPGMEGGSFNERRSHSNFIHSVNSYQLHDLRNDEIDVDVEAKMKNLALLKLRQDYAIQS